MTAVSERTIWALAVAGSLGIHGVFAAALILLPAPERPKVTDTAIAFQSVTVGMPESVAAGVTVRPTELETTVIGKTDAPKKVLRAAPAPGRPGETMLAPTSAAAGQLSPIVGSDVAATPHAPEAAPVVSSDRTLIDGTETTSRVARETDRSDLTALPPAAAENAKPAKSVAPTTIVPQVAHSEALRPQPTERLLLEPALPTTAAERPPAAALSPPAKSAAAVETSKDPARSASGRERPVAVAPRSEDMLDGLHPPAAAVGQNAKPRTVAPTADVKKPVVESPGPRTAAKEAGAVETSKEVASIPPERERPVAPSPASKDMSDGVRPPAAAFGQNAKPRTVAPTADAKRPVVESPGPRTAANQVEAVETSKDVASNPPERERPIVPASPSRDMSGSLQAPAVALGQGAKPRTAAPTADAKRPVVESPGPRTAAAAEEAVAMIAPARPPSAGVEGMGSFDQVLEYLADYRGGGCFLALPSPGSDGQVIIDGFSVAPGATAQLADELVRLTGMSVELNAHAVSPDQCPALSFARSLANFPLPGLEIQPQARAIASGEALLGRIENLRRKMLYLLVIDDEGKVHEIGNLFRNAAGEIAFDAPMTLTGGAVDTVQLLIAISSDDRLETFAARDGQHAGTYFAALEEEITRSRTGVDFGFAFFFVR